MKNRRNSLVSTSVLVMTIGVVFLAWEPQPLAAQVGGFKSYQLLVFCGSSGLASASFWHNVPDDGNVGRPLMGLHSICVGNCGGKTVSFEEALAGLPAGVSAAFKAELQNHEVKAAAGKANSLASCGSKCDASKYDDYLRKRQVAMELFKHASDLRLTASKLVADWWGDEAGNLRWEGEKEVAGDMAWDDFGRHVQRGMRGSRTALSQSWLARRGVPFALKGWNAIGWIADALLISDRGIRTAADYADYQNEAQKATKAAEEMWRKALADLDAYLTQKCADSRTVLPDEDRARLERAKAAIEEWDNNQNLYWDPIRNEAVTCSEAIRRANEYLKSGKISHLLSNPTFVMAAFAGSDDPPGKKALRAAISELDKAIPSWERLRVSISKYLRAQTSIEQKLESAFGVSGTSPAPGTPSIKPKQKVGAVTSDLLGGL
jgi:hypothetical protein